MIAAPLTRPCGHTRHVGTCPDCQRAAQASQRAQLTAAAGAATAWLAAHPARPPMKA